MKRVIIKNPNIHSQGETVWEVIDLEDNKVFFTTSDSQAERWNNDERYLVRKSPQRRPVRGYTTWMLNSKIDDYSLKLGYKE